MMHRDVACPSEHKYSSIFVNTMASMWPPPPAAYKSFAPKHDGAAEPSQETLAAHWPPPPAPPGDGDTYTAFGAVHHVRIHWS